MKTQLPLSTADDFAGPEGVPVALFNPAEAVAPNTNLLLGSPTLRPAPGTADGQNTFSRLLFWNQWRSTLIAGRVHNLNLTSGESATQQWDPGIISQYSVAFGWNQMPYGGKYATGTNERGDLAKGQALLGYENRGAGSYNQVFGQWNLNVAIGGIVLGRENYQGRAFYAFSNPSRRDIDVPGDVRAAFPAGEMIFLRNAIPGVSHTPWHAVVAAQVYNAASNVTTLTLDRTISELRSGIICMAEPSTAGTEGSAHRDQYIIGMRSSNTEDHQIALGLEACPPPSNEGALAFAAGCHQAVGDAQTLRLVMRSYTLSILTQYRFGPMGTNNAIMPVNTTWAVRGTVLLRRVDSARLVEMSAAAEFSGIFTRTTGSAIALGNTLSAYQGSAINAPGFSVSGGSNGQIVVAASVPMLTAPEKSGDPGGLVVSATAITGLQYCTMDAGRIRVSFVDQGGGVYYAQVSGTGILAHSASFTAAQNGLIALYADNSSGVGGSLFINAANIAAHVTDVVLIQMFPIYQGVCELRITSTSGGAS